ncbi:oxoacid transhydrogenase, mitochondrial [Seminavis robusta]|uniref:hydroxyacid-oxoacid transhydrogenase n=1 Tax=Seminavis robusta TaxID=568900 RepID=A0A9N8DFE0_9STRA|nr:oxoacid transhydrogenase, mitochondrial [Seminavis robusta]|eukprot:Sro66_g037280.1 oxoacid transhydrogenase, mitochondrial (475) ;mRNA; r:105744-107168
MVSSFGIRALLSRRCHRLGLGLATRATYSSQPFENDPICELAASNLRFGPGSTAEVGADLKHVLSAERVVVFTDRNVRKLPCMQVLLESLETNGISSVVIYDQVRVEPTDASFQHAIDFLTNTVGTDNYDAVVALGGGSTMDTAKAANLYAAFPPKGGFFDYVNPPVGKGLPVPAISQGSLPPLIAIPTTAGTGSETTGVAIFDDTKTQSKTGIANRRLKPTLGIVDPLNTLTQPREVACYSGLDVLCHAIESYTALYFNKRPKPETPLQRPTYQGSNPISDIWALFALETAAQNLQLAISDPENEDARAKMLMASSAAGMGFGNAGVHLCHGMSYPVASQCKSYTPASGYDTDHPIVPHGLSVFVNAPAVFRFTGVANPERHRTCAQILSGASTAPKSKQVADADVGLWLADELMELAVRLDVPMGLRTFGYTEEDIPSLVQGTLPQHRVTKISPRPVGQAELEDLFADALDE